ncbi:Ubiquitin-protein ligase [Ceraceosorus bombacis]|uniref:Ubiquitin-protein ligase n=1 Tax=Ceraceosorus bombacis TaxID=401625 RepID=A0A0P1BNP6_9BASI|nr:Ubiquitin-protein ligase [Ceraceosorus bombacis]
MTSALSSAVHKKLVREILSLQGPSQSADPRIKAAYSSKQALVRLDDETQDDYRIEVREEDLLDVRVWLMGPVGTPFEGGFFQMSIDFRNGAYPEQAPTVKLLTKIFHPNVSTRGDICVNSFNAGWSDQKGSASNFKGVDFCARTVLGLLVNPNPDSVLDQPEAGRLMHDSYEEFMRMAKVWTSAYALPRPACWGPAPCTEAAQTRILYATSLVSRKKISILDVFVPPFNVPLIGSGSCGRTTT